MSKYYVPLKNGCYILLKELPEYCCECPCSAEGSVYDMDSGKKTAFYVRCRVTDTEVVSCNPADLWPDWNAVPRPENCPIVHWLYISVGDCDGKN